MLSQVESEVNAKVITLEMWPILSLLMEINLTQYMLSSRGKTIQFTTYRSYMLFFNSITVLYINDYISQLHQNMALSVSNAIFRQSRSNKLSPFVFYMFIFFYIVIAPFPYLFKSAVLSETHTQTGNTFCQARLFLPLTITHLLNVC